MAEYQVKSLFIGENPTVSVKGLTPKLYPSRRRLPKTLAAFLQWNPRDGFKYEWENNQLIKLSEMFTPEQFHIVKNLTRLFATTKAYTNGDELQPEVKAQTTATRVRVPDIAYISKAQQVEMVMGKAPVPRFVIEIISKTDEHWETDSKLEEYFAAGVEVVWQIFPNSEKVYVYTSLEDIKVCRGETLCSAESVIEGFSITAKAVFEKP